MDFKNLCSFTLVLILIGLVVKWSQAEATTEMYTDMDPEMERHKEYIDLFGPDNPGNEIEGDDGVLEKYLEQGLNLTKVISNCPRNAFYYSFNPKHREAVKIVSRFLKRRDNASDIFTVAKDIRSTVNPKVWYTALTRAIFAREDLTVFQPAPPAELFPSSFVPAPVIKEACKQQPDFNPDKCVTLDEKLARGNGLEDKLWYFREDLMLNGHHWLWHAAYPFNRNIGRRADRRGELFYYLHYNILARYAAERISNHLPTLVPLYLQNDTVLDEGYHSFLNDTNSGRPWADRNPFTRIQDAQGDQAFVYNLFLNDMLTWRNRSLEAVNNGWALATNGSRVMLGPEDKTDVLSEMIESANASINQRYYGFPGFHNHGHVLIAWAGHPIFQTDPGVMADVATAMRDTVFYRWHAHINDIFLAYKKKLDPYPLEGDSKLQLRFDGVRIHNLQVISQRSEVPNHLHTFWNTRRLDLSRALDIWANFSCPLAVCTKHLDHDEFVYDLHVENQRETDTKSTVRIFLAPRYADPNKLVRLPFEDQRTLFFPLDSFVTTLNPGMNKIHRKSTDSALTVPWLKTLDELEKDLSQRVPSDPLCGCGWPHHLLLPKGQTNGGLYDLFVMVTNGEEDAVFEDDEVKSEDGAKRCYSPHIQCGTSERKYPDAKPMGYPFDRRPFNVHVVNGQWIWYNHATVSERPVATLEEYVAAIPNAMATQIRIFHKD